MLFEVLTGNGLSNNANRSGPKDATYMQSPSLHRTLLDPMHYADLAPEYVAAMKMPESPIKRSILAYLQSKAEAYERVNPKYWVDGNEQRPDHTNSSSWVGNIRYEPPKTGVGFGTAYINIGGREYSYPGVSPQGMVNLLNAPSLGRFLNNAKIEKYTRPDGRTAYRYRNQDFLAAYAK